MRKVFVAGHRGLVGTAVSLALGAAPDDYQLVFRTHGELDLELQEETRQFIFDERPDYVILSAAKVGGILANSTYPAEFLHSNLRIQLNVIDAALEAGVKRLIFLGSSCIYPRDCPQPIREDYLLTGPLEFTNRPYALAKIAGVESCWSFNRQHGTRFLALMPTNMYGPGDNYHPENSHVLPALIRRFHEAKVKGESSVVVWGTGSPLREFMYSLDLGAAVKFLLELSDATFEKLVDPAICPLINVGVGEDVTIRELADLVRTTVGYKGGLVFDPIKPDGTPRKLLDVSKIWDLGWRAEVKLEAGLKMAYEDFVKNHC